MIRSITKSEPYTSYSYYNVAKPIPIYREKKNSRTQGLGTYTHTGRELTLFLLFLTSDEFGIVLETPVLGGFGSTRKGFTYRIKVEKCYS